ncbi:hypothetical protein WJX84_007115 [Apatococcus fuscideae]|uniref:F-box domain-containing protein n=1 Tax=Apatococcus fuscideae TaxID=2026836 RepID=A0AAW1TG75_9CHLO
MDNTRLAQSPEHDGIAMLPLDLWMRVLGHLDTADRMKARGVCQAFSHFGQGENVTVKSSVLTESHAISLMVFLGRQAKPASNRPMLDLREAELLVRMVPAGLKALQLHTNAAIVSSAAWARIPALTELQLRLSDKAPVPPHTPGLPHSAAGLSSLTSLRILTFPQTDAPAGLIEPSLLALPFLQDLNFGEDPFSCKPELSAFPMLTEVQVLGANSALPGWIQGQSILSLGCSHLSISCRNIDIAELQCEVLHIFLDDDENMISVHDLLTMPRLRCLHLSKFRPRFARERASEPLALYLEGLDSVIRKTF